MTLYAVTGLVAYWFRDVPASKLFGWAIALSLVNVILFAAIGTTLYHQQIASQAAGASADLIRNWDANYHSFYPTAQQYADDLAIYDGGWLGIVTFEAGKASRIVTNTILLLPDTLGLMLFGMAAYKSGFLTGAWGDGQYRRIAAWGISLGLAGFGALVVADIASDFSVPVVLAGFMTAVAPFRIGMAFGYAALFILMARNLGPIAQRFAAVGRAAFTNYLGTSLIMTAVFYGWGLGFYGDLTRAEAWLFVPAVWLIMLAWSKPWLDRFNYGPFEWAWRSLSRGELQPMRRFPPSAQVEEMS